MITARYLFILGTTAVVLSSQSVPKLEVRSNFSLPLRELVNKSSVVVIGIPLSVTPLGSTRQVGEAVVRLNQIEATVESVLKGNLGGKDKVEFWQYSWSGTFLPKGDLSADFVTPGMRSVFFLDHEHSTLRSTVDVVQSRLGLIGGQFQDRMLDSKMAVEEKIARLLLSLGTSSDPDSFTRSLPNSVYYSMQLIGKVGTVRLLQDLVSRSVGKVRASACLELSRGFPGQGSCLRDLLRNRDTDGETRRLAEKQLTTNLNRDAAIKRALQKNPTNWLEGHSRSQNPADVRDELSLLAMHPDQEIRHIACSLMTRHFRGENLLECRKN